MVFINLLRRYSTLEYFLCFINTFFTLLKREYSFFNVEYNDSCQMPKYFFADTSFKSKTFDLVLNFSNEELDIDKMFMCVSKKRPDSVMLILSAKAT